MIAARRRAEDRMDDVTSDRRRGGSSKLAAAIRRARIEEAERSDVLTVLRGVEIARLEMLYEATRPVLEQVPEHVDLFDAGLAPGERPRLYIDMIGFVEMARDRRTYRFLQDTRHGRITIAESDDLETMTDAVAGYVARRLVEREKALAADKTIEEVVEQYLDDVAAAGQPDVALRPRGERPSRRQGPPTRSLVRPARRSGFGRLMIAAVIHIVEYLGVLTFLALLVGGGFFAYHLVLSWLAGSPRLPG
jgi:hypothetical protein